MNRKRLLGVIMSLILAFCVVGCSYSNIGSSFLTGIGNENESEGNSENSEDIGQTILKLGAEQTVAIKEILGKYGVETSYNADKNTSSSITISKDENDCSNKEATGYSINTNKVVKVNDGGSHQYGIIYNAYIDKNDNKPTYVYQITMEFSTKEEFKIDNFKMLKELVEEVHGEDYDFLSLEDFMKEQLEDAKSGGVVGGETRDLGSFRECIEDGSNNTEAGTYVLTYSLTLKE